MSEAGTYTVESDIGGTEEEGARSEIDQVFGVHETYSTETVVPVEGSPSRREEMGLYNTEGHTNRMDASDDVGDTQPERVQVGW